MFLARVAKQLELSIRYENKAVCECQRAIASTTRDGSCDWENGGIPLGEESGSIAEYSSKALVQRKGCKLAKFL